MTRFIVISPKFLYCVRNLLSLLGTLFKGMGSGPHGAARPLWVVSSGMKERRLF